MAHAARVAGRLLGVRRVAWAGLQAAGGAIRGSLGLGMGRLLARERTGAAGVQEQQQQQELEHDGPMRVEQPEHAEDEDGEPWQRAREESGGSGRMGGEDEDGSGRMGGENDEGVRAAGRLRCGKFACMRGVLRGVRTAQAWVMGRMFRCWVWLDRGETMRCGWRGVRGA